MTDTPATRTAQAEIARLQTDQVFVLEFNSSDPLTRAKARKQLQELHQRAYPGQSEL